MKQEQLERIAQGDLHFTVPSVVTFVVTIGLLVLLFAFELSHTVQLMLVVCIAGLLVSNVYQHFNQRINALLELTQISKVDSENNETVPER